MSREPVRVFISHSSLDKERFVRGLAQQLLDEAFEVWYDEWSLLAGDSLADRIIEEGLGLSDVVIAVISQHSIKSDWVRKELSVATVMEISRRCRIIPVVIDDVELPVKLQDLVRVSISDTSSYGSELERIVAGVRGADESRSGFRMSRVSPPATIPALLPPPPRGFVNRAKQLAQLNGVLAESEAADRPCVAMLLGMPGVGKSALAMKWCNSVSDQFPDGVLHVDFAAQGKDTLPDISDVLISLLRDLGVSDEALPSNLEAQVKTYRRLTSSKRLLIVAENTTDPAQVKQVLPYGRGSVMVATAGSYMSELVTDPQVSAEPIELQSLDDADALTMLQAMVGIRTPGDAEDDLAELSMLCGRLPFALAFSGAFLRRHQTRRIRDFINDVCVDGETLTAVSGNYVKLALDVVCGSFGPQLRAFYRRLGLFPGNVFGPHAAAAIAAVPQREAARFLEELHNAHLLVDAGSGYYEIHRLVREHMVSLCVAEESKQTREGLGAGLVEWYHGALRMADRAIAQERLRVATDDEVSSPVEFPEFPTARAAYGWYAEERHNVVAVLRLADDLGRAERVWQMAESLWLMLLGRRSFAIWKACDTLGAEAAKACGHRDAEARLRSHLARALAELGQHEDSRNEMHIALALVQASDNAALRASIRESQGTCEFLAGDNEAALAAFDEVRVEMRALGRARSVAIADLLRSRVFIAEKRHAEAFDAARSCQTAFEDLGDDVNAAKAALEAMRANAESQGADHAGDEVERTIEMLNGVGLAYHAALAHELAARVFDRSNRRKDADRHRREAYRLYRDVGHEKAELLEPMLNAGSS